uniref:Splicing factor YJU2 n=1 Tax=Panagrolaimus sp. JU765 TaxID=591449 RepID=A0AC34RKT4_9BILA
MTGTERKVFQKYYPPDFDASKLPRAKGKRNRQFVQRVMVPYNMQCNTCHEYIYKGKKFNMRRETAEGENYLGLKIFRFYFRCPNCIADISFKTDLENCDYSQEHGATRLFDPFKYYQDKAREQDAQEEAEKNDPMKMLEKRTQMSRQEMKAMGELEEIQELNRRNERIDARDYVLDDKQKAFLIAEMEKQQKEEDDNYVRQIFNKVQNNGKIYKRIEDDDTDFTTSSLLFPKESKKPGEKELVEALLTGQVKTVGEPGPSNVNADLKKSKESLKNLVVRKPAVKKSGESSTTATAEAGPSGISTLNLPGPSRPTKEQSNQGLPVSNPLKRPASNVPESKQEQPKGNAKKALVSAYGSDSD